MITQVKALLTGQVVEKGFQERFIDKKPKGEGDGGTLRRDPQEDRATGHRVHLLD